MQPTSHRFPENAHDALTDAQLQQALGNVRVNFIEKRAEAVAKLPEFDALRKAGREMRDRVLSDLDTRVTSQLNPRKSAPFSVWIGADGKVAWEREGFALSERDAIAKAMAQFVAGQPLTNVDALEKPAADKK